MISISVDGHIIDTLLDLGDHHHQLGVEHLVVLAHGLNKGLDDSSSVVVHGDLDDVAHDGVDDLSQVIAGADIDDLLAEVVTKLVYHHAVEDTNHALDKLAGEAGKSILVGEFLEFLLDQAASGLIEGQELDLVDHLKLIVGELDHWDWLLLDDLWGWLILELEGLWLGVEGVELLLWWHHLEVARVHDWLGWLESLVVEVDHEWLEGSRHLLVEDRWLLEWWKDLLG